MREAWLQAFDDYVLWGGRWQECSFRTGRYGNGTPALQLIRGGEVDRVLTVALHEVPGALLRDDELVLRWMADGGAMADQELSRVLRAAGIFGQPKRTVDAGHVDSYAAVVPLARCVLDVTGHSVGDPVVVCRGCRAAQKQLIETMVQQRQAADSARILRGMKQ